ncbi:hypothetical protein D9V37_19055 [Nocardioides mangrovicus]|uniref:Ubiquinone biosynthesis protein UbiA n=1 Tax=Nocardioides mangrovicus TaxID=2478913 RepID=A0A3L8NZ00_9ACTN|nr:hypothetical protein D9V37_19055 [Nocardioides mangrovicus]
MLGAAHPGPALAVTVLGGLLALAWGAGLVTVVLVAAAVLTSQLSIGWSNDLIDLRRDVAVGRADKPLATGALPLGAVRAACALAVVLTVPLGFALGGLAGLVHLLNTAAGWAYNLGLKATAWSWLPYAVAFGGLPLFVGLDAPPVRGWSLAAGALLGIGAHLLNVLPDLADDAATGVRGLPHRIGERGSRVGAVAVLVAATVVMVLGARPGAVAGGVALAAALGLAAAALLGRGRVPFAAAVAIALVDVAILLLVR